MRYKHHLIFPVFVLFSLFLIRWLFVPLLGVTSALLLFAVVVGLVWAFEAKRHSRFDLENDKNFQALAEAIPQIIWTADANGDSGFVSQRWFDYTGLDRKRVRAHEWAQTVHPEDLDRVTKQWSQVAASGENYEVQYRLRDRDGNYRWHLERARAVRDKKGDVIRWFGVCIDIHEQIVIQKQMNDTANILRTGQEELKQALMKAETAGKMKDEFLATLSHELRTPMSAILGWAEFLTSKARSPEVVKQGLDTIHRNAILQSELISDLLDVSRIICGKFQLSSEVILVTDVVERTVDSCRLMAAEKGIVIEVGEGGEEAKVIGDSSRIQQILWNILTNAIKFTHRGGDIRVFTAVNQDRVDITVRDTGVGISAEFLPHVFERFRQADSSITRQYGGMGLGLAIVRHLAEMHEGSIRAESEGIGKGATFIVSLPLAKGEELRQLDGVALSLAPEIDEAPDCGLDLSGFRILIVDDAIDTLLLLQQVLSVDGAEVLMAHSAAEAFQLFTDNFVDLIISDIGMPGEDGYQLMQRIRSHERERDLFSIPAVALTAYARETDIRKSREAGFNRHLAKPLTPKRLHALLSEMLDDELQYAQNMKAASRVVGSAASAKYSGLMPSSPNELLSRP